MIEGFFKGYPFAGIKSRELFPNRPLVTIITEGLVDIDAKYNERLFPGYDLNDPKSEGDFMAHRLFDYQMALAAAEEQIEDIFAQHPFIPEDFHFEKHVDPEDAKNVYYTHALCALSPVRDEAMYWMVMCDNFKKPIKVYFYNVAVAYHYFVAIGVIDPEADVTEIIDVTPSQEELDKMLAEGESKYFAGIDPYSEDGKITHAVVHKDGIVETPQSPLMQAVDRHGKLMEDIKLITDTFPVEPEHVKQSPSESTEDYYAGEKKNIEQLGQIGPMEKKLEEESKRNPHLKAVK